MAAVPGADPEPRPKVELPQGAEPFLREPVRAGGTDTLVECMSENAWGPHAHDEQWQNLMIFPPGYTDFDLVSPVGRKSAGRVQAGQVWTLPPGWTHTVRLREKADVILTFADDERVRKYCPALPRKPSLHDLNDYVAAQRGIPDLCLELRQFSTVPNGPSDWRVANAGAHLTSLLFEAHPALNHNGRRKENRLAAQIFDLVKAHWTARASERVPVEKLAAGLGVSARHFRRLFQLMTGKSPQAWVMLQKATHAKTLLQSGKTVEETVGLAGFADAAHLHRVIFEHYGVAPGALRRLAETSGPDHS